MCHLFAHQAQRDYESQTRSLRMGGHCTSIRLEMSFWDTLEEIAAKEGMSLAKFLTTLHDEVLDHLALLGLHQRGVDLHRLHVHLRGHSHGDEATAGQPLDLDVIEFVLHRLHLGLQLSRLFHHAKKISHELSL